MMFRGDGPANAHSRALEILCCCTNHEDVCFIDVVDIFQGADRFRVVKKLIRFIDDSVAVIGRAKVDQFFQLIATPGNSRRIARIAANDKDYDTAIEAYEYIVKTKGVMSSFYVDSKREALRNKRDRIAHSQMQKIRQNITCLRNRVLTVIFQGSK